VTRQNSQDVPADEKSIELARRLGEARSNAKQWSEVADFVRDELIDHVKLLAATVSVDEPKAVVAAGGVKILSISESTRKTLDVDRVKIEHPEIDWDSYYKVSSSTQIRVGKF
jgi:hypothetical protein